MMIYFKITLEKWPELNIMKCWCANEADRDRKHMKTVCWCCHCDH